MEIFTDDWVDAKEMSYKYPNTFDFPTQYELENITIGDSVKISNGFERFWVEIKEVNKLYLIGRVDNKLITREYNLNNLVMFEKKNVYDIRTIEDKEEYLKNLNNKIKFLYKLKKKK
jgi:hypothetical protein